MSEIFASILWRVIGFAVILFSILPIAGWVGAPDSGPIWRLNMSAWLIGCSVVAVVGCLAGRLGGKVRVEAPRIPDPVYKLAPPLLAVVLAGLSALAMQDAFAGNPHLIDEMAQLFQGKVFASGRLAAPVPSPPDFFLITQTFVVDDSWVSQYPPGQALLFALGFSLHAEWLVNPLLGGVGVLLVFSTASGLYDRTTGLLAALLWAGSSWVLFMSATYMNHVGATTFALAAWALIWSPKDLKRWHLVGAGFFLAATAATRPLDAVAASLPIGVWLLTRRPMTAIGWVAVGTVPVMAAWGFMNWKLFGNPATMGYSALSGSELSLGFHTDPWGREYTPLVALSNMAVAVRRLSIHLFEWPIPALLPVAAWGLLASKKRQGDLVLALGVMAGPVLYFFYWHSGFYPGPRFYYISAPFLVLATARAWAWAWGHLGRSKRFGLRWDVSLTAMAAVVLLWGWVSLSPGRWDFYKSQLVSLKLHPERQLEEQSVSKALVLVPESWGSRIVVSLWGLGVSPPLVERAYNRIDACDLHTFVQQARQSGIVGPVLSDSLRHLLAASDLQANALRNWPDPSLRLRQRTTMPESCRIELERDLQGFTVYGHLGWRNRIGLDSGLVFARDLYERNTELLARYEGWQVWRYAPPPDDPEGIPVLTLIRDQS